VISTSPHARHSRPLPTSATSKHIFPLNPKDHEELTNKELSASDWIQLLQNSDTEIC